LDVVDLPDPIPGDDETLFDILLERGELRRHPPPGVGQLTSWRGWRQNTKSPEQRAGGTG